MPDWLHSLLYIAVIASTAYLGSYYAQNIFGLFGGLIVGHFLATAIIKRLPGFWGN